MWQEYFRFIKLRPGRVVTTLFGELDFSNPNIPLHKIQTLYENDFPYLAPTPKGLEELYGMPQEQDKSQKVNPALAGKSADPAPATKDTKIKVKSKKTKVLTR